MQSEMPQISWKCEFVENHPLFNEVYIVTGSIHRHRTNPDYGVFVGYNEAIPFRHWHDASARAQKHWLLYICNYIETRLKELLRGEGS